MKIKDYIKWILLIVPLVVAGCGSKKTAIGSSRPSDGAWADATQQKRNFIYKVSDNAAYARNIVSKITFSLKAGGKDVSVDGVLSMRKNDVIRIQLTPLGLLEVGRIELTKDYVLIVDRIHKEFVKADYGKVEFLENNGLSFYSLQALFWNHLFAPGATEMTDAIVQRFDADLGVEAEEVPVFLSQKNMTCQWLANRETGLIKQATVEYGSQTHGRSALTWHYSDFRPLGSKSFPMHHLFAFNSSMLGSKNNAQVMLKLKNISTDDDWNPCTEVSGKYREVSIQEALAKLISL